MYTRCSAMQAPGMYFCGGLQSTATDFNAASYWDTSASIFFLWRLTPIAGDQVTVEDTDRCSGVWRHCGKEIDLEPDPPTYLWVQACFVAPTATFIHNYPDFCWCCSFLPAPVKGRSWGDLRQFRAYDHPVAWKAMACTGILKLGLFQFLNVDKKAAIKLLTFPGMGWLHSTLYFNCKSLDLMQGSLGLNCSLMFPVMLLWLSMGISFLYFPLFTMFWNSYSKAKMFIRTCLMH